MSPFAPSRSLSLLCQPHFPPRHLRVRLFAARSCPRPDFFFARSLSHCVSPLLGLLSLNPLLSVPVPRWDVADPRFCFLHPLSGQPAQNGSFGRHPLDGCYPARISPTFSFHTPIVVYRLSCSTGGIAEPLLRPDNLFLFSTFGQAILTLASLLSLRAQ